MMYFKIECGKGRLLVRADSEDFARRAVREEYGRSVGDIRILGSHATLAEAQHMELSVLGYLDAETGQFCRDESGGRLMPLHWQMLLPESLGGMNLKAKGTELLENFLWRQEGKSEREVRALLVHHGLPAPECVEDDDEEDDGGSTNGG